nr:transposase [Microcystis sp. M176S2]
MSPCQSKKKKGSQKRLKQKSKVARLHLKVSRQRKDFAIKTAKALIQSILCTATTCIFYSGTII